MAPKTNFNKVALMGRHRGESIAETLTTLNDYLLSNNVSVVIEASSADMLLGQKLTAIAGNELGKHSDLLIVVGGDGSMLNAAKLAAQQDLPVLGINRGRLGFLTDIHPDKLHKVGDVLAGKFREEKRLMLEAKIQHNDNLIATGCALNDVVLFPGSLPHMIEFDILIDDVFVCSQRSDGLIVATPTGSTAYALSGGGPILHPQSDVLALVPMFPHNLSSRPVVVDSNNKIEIAIHSSNEDSPRVSCDGQQRVTIPPGSKIQVQKKKHTLRLIHPLDYNYFETLRLKLGWQA